MFIAFYILSATDTGFINTVGSGYLDARRLLKIKAMVDLQAHHTFPLRFALHCTCMEPPRKEKDE